MAIASGIAKRVVIKKETAWGAAAPVRTGAAYLRYVTSDLSLKKAAYESNEIRTDYQVSDMRHGVRSVGGAHSGELAPGSYPLLFAGMLRQNFAVVTAISSLTLTITGTANPFTVARSAGNFLSDGLRIGHVVQLSGGTLNANNLLKNILVVAINISGADFTGVVLSPTSPTLTAQSGIASTSVTVKGKVAYTPSTGHTDDSFAIEYDYSDIAQSELFLGNKIASAEIALPPTGMATCKFDFMGKDLADATVGRGGVATNTAYFTGASAALAGGIVAAVNGAIYVNGAAVALLTGMTINYAGGMSAEPVVGSSVYPDITEGRVKISGSISVLFQDATFRNYFDNETETPIVAAFTSTNDANSEFLSICMPRAKVGGADKTGTEKGLSQTLPFTALVNASNTTANLTTLQIQDSLAP